jgi:hypothetical protein
LAEETKRLDQEAKRSRRLYRLALVNSGIWALAIIALVFVIQSAPSAKGLYVILAGGTAISIALVSAIRKA